MNLPRIFLEIYFIILETRIDNLKELKTVRCNLVVVGTNPTNALLYNTHHKLFEYYLGLFA